MAKVWEYPKWRRVALQVAMWAILGATLGMAALVANHRRSTAFAAPIAVGPFNVQVPTGWQTSTPIPGTTMAKLVAREKKATRGKSSKQVVFFIGTVTAPGTVQEFLAQQEIGLQPVSAESGDETDNDHTVPIAGFDGSMYVQSSIRVIGPEAFFPTTLYFAGVVLPDGTALGVRYTCDGAFNGADLDTFGQILDRVTLRDK